MSAQTPISEKTKCYHCGDPCSIQEIDYSGHKFCCNGCKSVYQILEENDLCNYYNADTHVGVNPGSKNRQRFDFLDNDDIAGKLFEFQNDKIVKISFRVPQMHCASCVWLLEKLYRLNPAIQYSSVNYPRKEVRITYLKSQAKLSDIVLLLSDLGYEPDLSLADASGEKNKKVNRKLYFQLGIAGFCFGNVMLFSMPEYFDLTGDLSTSFKEYFGFINLLISIPVLLYSDLDYFKSALGGIRQRQINLDVPLSLGMLTLFITSSFEVISGVGPGYFDSFTGLVFFLLLGKAFQIKTFNNISFERDYKSYFPLYTNIINNGKVETKSLEHLKKGDRIQIRNNDLIPADSILLKGKAFIDYSFVTGESEPVFLELGEIIYAGGKQKGEAIEMEVVNNVSNSYLTSLWNQDEFTKDQNGVLKSISDVVAKWFTYIVLSIAILAFAFWLPNIEQAVKVFAAVLIIACPCALALSIPYTFGNTIRLLARKGIYLKSAEIIEKLSKVKHIVFDKTGTITKSEGRKVKYQGATLIASELQMLKSLSGQSSHPMSRAIHENINSSNGQIVQNFKEHINKGIEGSINGNHLKLGSASFMGLPEESGSFFSIDDNIKGRFNLEQEARSESANLISSLAENYDLSLCSGDNKENVDHFRPLFPANSEFLSNQSPEEKLRFIRAIKSEGKDVLMIGDGLNDAGALKASDVGISMTDNTGHFSPASDVIMDSKAYSEIDQLLDFSKYSVNIVKISFIISALYNVTGLYFAVQGLLTPVFAAILMPLSSVSVVLFTTISTNFKSRIKSMK